VIGAGKKILGGAKGMLGRLVGDAKLQVAGKAQNAVGSLKDSLRR
jgi:uncharacterized protein YjbJ (UPF0337 family)